MKKYKSFLNEKFNQLMHDCNNDIVDILKKSGYYVRYHSRIYQDTIIEKTELISTTYTNSEVKYNEIVYINAYSFIKLKEKSENYSDDYFLYPVYLLEKLKNKDAINYQELPFYDDLFKVLDYYNMHKNMEDFNI